ncbi:hypothetical protein ACRRTK_014546 [Alexandromys fortis]
MEGQTWLGLSCEALPGGPEAAQREGRLEVGPGQQWVEGGSIRTVCHLLGLVVLLGSDCLLWVTLALGERESHEEAVNIAESG